MFISSTLFSIEEKRKQEMRELGAAINVALGYYRHRCLLGSSIIVSHCPGKGRVFADLLCRSYSERVASAETRRG